MIPTRLPAQARSSNRAPQAEIVLGERVLAAPHARIGATVIVSVAGLARRRAQKIVGTAVFPTVGDTIGLGTGAALTVAGLRGLAPPSLPFPPPRAPW